MWLKCKEYELGPMPVEGTSVHSKLPRCDYAPQISWALNLLAFQGWTSNSYIDLGPIGIPGMFRQHSRLALIADILACLCVIVLIVGSPHTPTQTGREELLSPQMTQEAGYVNCTNLKPRSYHVTINQRNHDLSIHSSLPVVIFERDDYKKSEWD